MGKWDEPGVNTEAISTRAKNATSDRVRERIENVILPNMTGYGESAGSWLRGIRNDFYILVADPDDPCGAGHYTGWRSQEIRELYYIIYGEPLFE